MVYEHNTIKWISNLKVRWYVARHGSNLVYVELKGTQRKREPIIIRTIYLVGKGGKPRAVYSEIYTLDKASEILEAERAILESLRMYRSENPEPTISRLKMQISRLEGILVQVKNLVNEVEEVIRYGEGSSK